MSRPIAPTLFLELADCQGIRLGAPFFGAVSVTASLLRRLRRLARLCERERLAWIVTRDVEPVYWDTPESEFTDEAAMWHLVGTAIYVELSARRRVRGGYGKLEVVGQSPVFDLAELEHMRRHGIKLDFREHSQQDGAGAGAEPFALAVMLRLRNRGLWPNTKDP